MDDLAKIRQRAVAWRDDETHKKWFALQIFMHGDLSALESDAPMDELAPNREGCADLPDYGEINLPLGPMGIQNHGEVNSRINVQGLVHVKPVFNWVTDDPIMKQVNDGWIRQSWEDADWANEFYLAGMEVEAQGIAACEWGLDPSGRVVCHHRPMLDTIRDRMYASPSQWRGQFHRRRIDLDEAGEKYGNIYSEKELKNLAVDFFPTRVGDKNKSRSDSNNRVPVIYEWHYQDIQHECYFLGSIADSKDNVVAYDNNLELKRVTKAGVNPHGFIPWAWWIDSYLPSSNTPRGKSETTIRLATMLNELENFMVETIRRGITLIGVNDRADPKFLEEIKALKGSKDVMKLLFVTGAGDIKELLSRLPAEQIQEGVIMLRGILKDELNAATGVMDMQRGQELQRDRVTRYEVSTLKSMQGVQARHLRERYARFLERGVQIARALGALWDDRPRILQLEDGSIDTSFFPIQPLLAVPMVVSADPETMYYLSEDEKRMRAIEEFNAYKLKAIELGVADPYRTFDRLYKQVGYKDPVAEGLFSPAEYQMIQEQMAIAQAAGLGPNQEQDGSQPDNQGQSGGGGSQPAQQ